MKLARLLLAPLAAFACAILPSFAVAADAPRPSTANANVHVLAPLHIAGLDRDRIVRIYLPPGYADGDRRYPVLYLQDGQNLFDDATSYVGEWGVDEALDALAAEGLPFIAVGIDHGGEKRVTELSPWHNEEFGKPEGEQYLRFLVDTVKPFVEANYRTLPGRDNTLVGGSSLGGLMAHYAVVEHPDLFGKALIFSPAYWYGGDAPYAHAISRCLPAGTRLYLVTGSKEGAQMVDSLARMTKLLEEHPTPGVAVFSEVRQGAEHNETFWKNEFPQAMRWLFAPDK
jgi:predicted alpha/beta superfamily hydrolase